MSQIRALILDKDGTLFPYSIWAGPIRRCLEDNLPTGKRRNREEITDAFLSVLSIENGKIKPESLLYDRKKRLKGILKLIGLTLKYHLRPIAAARGFLRIKRRSEYGFREELEKYDLTAVRNTLQTLKKKGLVLALFSNDSPRSVSIIMDALSPFIFDYYVDSSSRIRKPSPYAVGVFAELNGLMPDEVAILSDTPEDLVMARKAGCGNVIAIEGSLDEKTLSEYSDRVIHSFEEILSVID